jgi:hypothetical protein
MKKLSSVLIMMLISIVCFGQDTIRDTVVQVLSSFSSDVQTTVFGNISYGVYVGCFILAIMGLYIRWYLSAKKGIKNNTNSPDKFNWEYWWKDNLVPKLASILFTIFIIFLSLRFLTQLAPDYLTLPIGFVAVLLGVAFDWWVSKWQNIPLPKKEG